MGLSISFSNRSRSWNRLDDILDAIHPSPKRTRLNLSMPKLDYGAAPIWSLARLGALHQQRSSEFAFGGQCHTRYQATEIALKPNSPLPRPKLDTDFGKPHTKSLRDDVLLDPGLDSIELPV